MFKIEYKITDLPEYDFFKGQYGFFKFICNENSYGMVLDDLKKNKKTNISDEEFDEEFEKLMADVYVCDWFERFIRVAEKLKTNDYILLSDVDSYCAWIEFKSEGDYLIISVPYSDKTNERFDVDCELKIEPWGYEWKNQKILKSEFKEELIKQVKNYIKEIEDGDAPKDFIEDLKYRINRLEHSKYLDSKI